jgi:hypothetical protein
MNSRFGAKSFREKRGHFMSSDEGVLPIEEWASETIRHWLWDYDDEVAAELRKLPAHVLQAAIDENIAEAQQEIDGAPEAISKATKEIEAVVASARDHIRALHQFRKELTSRK